MKSFPIIKAKQTTVSIIKRTCGECTACCTFTTKKVLGEHYAFGVPCKYLDNGCSIYESRPYDPCRGFECSWLHSPSMIPDWMIPCFSNVILINRKGYLAAIICDKSKDYEPAVEWLINFQKEKNCNIAIIIDDIQMSYGDPEWVKNQTNLGEDSASERKNI